MINIRWNSQYGCVYVDGSHMTHDLELGDEVKMDCHAPKVHIFDSVDIFSPNFSYMIFDTGLRSPVNR